MNPDDSDQDFIELCVRDLSGETTDEEKRALNRIMADEEKRDLYISLQHTWQNAQDDRELERFDVESAFNILSERLELAEERPAEVFVRKSDERLVDNVQNKEASPSTTPGQVFKRYIWPLTIGAAAAIFILSAIVTTIFGPSSDSSMHAETLPQQILITRNGQQSNFVLSDGSKIRLNAASKLVVTGDFGEQERRVELTGEAFFEVAHDVDSPFIVQARGVETRVLGTKFNVRDYPEDIETEVTLTEGKVEVSSAGDEDDTPTVLAPGQQYRYNNLSQTQNVQTADQIEALSWMDGVILFRNEPLPGALDTIGRHYDVVFTIMDAELKDQTLSITFNDDPLDEVIKLLELTNRMRFERGKSLGGAEQIKVFAVN